MGAQGVAVGCEDGEEVVDAVALVGGYGDVGAADGVAVDLRDGSAMVVPLVQVGQLDIEDGCLHLVEAAVDSSVGEDVVAVAAVVGKGTDAVGKVGMVGGDGSCIAEGTEVLRGIEAVGGGKAERTGELVGVDYELSAAVCLGIVFEDGDVVLPAHVGYLGGVGTGAVEVDEHDGADVGGDGAGYCLGTDLEGVGVGLYEQGLQSGTADGDDGGDVGVGGYDDLASAGYVTELLGGDEHEGEGVESVATAYAVASADVGGIGFLEGFGLAAPQVSAGGDDGGCRCGELRGEGSVDCLEVEEGYVEGFICHTSFRSSAGSRRR